MLSSIPTHSDLLRGCSIKVLTGELNPFSGQVNRNGRLRVYGNPVLSVFGGGTHQSSQRVLRAASRRYTCSDHDTCPVLGF